MKNSTQGKTVPVSDRIVAALLLLLTSPVLLSRLLRQAIGLADYFTEKTFHRGLFQQQDLLVYKEGGERKAPLLVEVVKGRIALVGPRLIAVDDIADAASMPFAEMHFAATPGVFSLFELRRHTGLDFLEEQECDLEYLENRGFGARLKIVVRSVLASAMYRTGEVMRDAAAFEVLGVRIDNWSMTESLARIARAVESRVSTTVFFANAHTLNLSYEDASFRDTLNNVDVLLPDGSGIEVACRRQGVRRKGNINGTDMLPLLCNTLAEKGGSVFFLGGEEGIASTAAQNLEKRTPGLHVAGTLNGFFDKDNCDDVIAQINAAQPDVLLVGMGQPLQERWVAQNRHRLDVPVVMAVGGLFDFYAEKVSRAPVWLRELGLEWTWRLLQEPGRMWKRYVIGNPLFLLRIRRATPR